MTFGSKGHLQEIYDSGLAKLKELEDAALVDLKSLAEPHILSKMSKEDDSLPWLENKDTELGSELKTFMQTMLSRLDNVINVEIAETNKHLTLAVQETISLSEKLKGTIAEIRRSYEESLRYSKDKSSCQYEGACAQAQIEIERENHRSSKQLTAHGTFIVNSLQQKLDHMLWQSRTEEKQVQAQLFKMFMGRAAKVDTHFSSLMQELSCDFETHFQEYEGIFKTYEDELDKELRDRVGQMEEQSAHSENEIREVFTVQHDEHMEGLENKLTEVMEKLTGLQEDVKQSLQKHTGDLNSNLSDAALTVRETLTQRCNLLNKQIDDLSCSFRQSTENKLNACLSFKSELEGEVSSIVEHICKELQVTKDASESRLTDLMMSAVDGVKSIVEKVENDIRSEGLRCEKQLEMDTSSVRSEIESSMAGFLHQMEKHRTAALEEINRAASNLDDTKRPRPKRSKKERRSSEAKCGEEPCEAERLEKERRSSDIESKQRGEEPEIL